MPVAATPVVRAAPAIEGLNSCGNPLSWGSTGSRTIGSGHSGVCASIDRSPAMPAFVVQDPVSSGKDPVSSGKDPVSSGKDMHESRDARESEQTDAVRERLRHGRRAGGRGHLVGAATIWPGSTGVAVVHAWHTTPPAPFDACGASDDTADDPV